MSSYQTFIECSTAQLPFEATRSGQQTTHICTTYRPIFPGCSQILFPWSDGVAGKVDKAKELADRLLPMCRQLGDLEGEALMNELIGRAVQERGSCLGWNFGVSVDHHLRLDSRVPQCSLGQHQCSGPLFLAKGWIHTYTYYIIPLSYMT